MLVLQPSPVLNNMAENVHDPSIQEVEEGSQTQGHLRLYNEFESQGAVEALSQQRTKPTFFGIFLLQQFICLMIVNTKN